MRSILFATAAVFGIASAASAASIPGTDFTAATNVEGSSTAGPSSTNANQVIFTGNSNRTGVASTMYTGDFTYSGTLRPTSGDDDTVGLTFGYVDGDNNYRLGWEGGGDWDFEAGGSNAIGNNGLWLIAETGGVATSLFSNATLFWSLNTDYDFSIAVAQGNISFEIKQGNTVLESQTVAATRSTDGKVGVYANSQAGVFSNLDVTPITTGGPSVVPLPAAGWMLIAAIGALGLRGRRTRA